ncbi:MAG TPA: SMP-30/gluconolactonase/LRE family protein [Alphaproteobacteria bacterium]|nr:SMP-30/gluconolactonase/LRE family protein [Alphaproteobacteria bacterium]
MSKPRIECVVDARAEIGEGPVWDERRRVLFWVDISGRILHCFDPSSGDDRVISLPEEIGCVALCLRGEGLIAAMKSGFARLDAASGELEYLHDPEADRPGNRFNDGACDTGGRLWAGTMKMDETRAQPIGALYRFGPVGACLRILDGLWTPNGLAFSPDGRTMYLSDSHPSVRTIWALDYDPGNGVASNRRTFFDTRTLAGRPDGGAVDADGCYWMAGVGGWQLVRFTPGGIVDRIIDMPVEKPTKIAFGGPRLDVMYVTSIGRGIAREARLRQPYAGGLFAVEAGVAGLPANRFGL